MLVFDKGFMTLKTKYIVPLSPYTVQYNHLNACNVKNMLINKVSSVEQDGLDYVYRFDKDFLMKGLMGDIELFYIRVLQQREDALQVASVNKKVTANWNIVTNYYYGFFLASLLLRICFRGNIFLDMAYKKKLEEITSVMLGEAISINSNAIYCVEKQDSDYVLRIKKANDNTHELVWRELDKLLDDLVRFSKPNSDEYTVLSVIKHINNTLNNTYPSQLRNRVNYQVPYGLKYLDGDLYHKDIFIQHNWLKEILEFNSEIKDDDNYIVRMSVAYINYLERLTFKLLDEYYQIRGNENGILSKINKNRTEKIILPEYPFLYDA